MPWGHVLLAGSVLAVLLGLITFGLPCLAVGVAVVVCLTMTEGRGGLIVLILDLVLCMLGFIGGIVASYVLWIR
jgi:hypothetical protein